MTSLTNFTRRQLLTIALAAFFVLAGGAQAQTPAPSASAPAVMQVPAPPQQDLAASAFLIRTGVPAAGFSAGEGAVRVEGADTRIFRSVNDAQNNFKTSLFHVTDNSVAVLSVGVPVGFIVYGLAADDRSALNTGVLLSASEVLTYGLNHALKITIRRSRPYAALPDVHVNDLESADQYSFPSGHSAGAFALATMLTLRYPKPAVYLPAYIWAGLVGYGRVYNGVHYPSDVLGGALVGAGSAALTFGLRGTLIGWFDRVTGRKTEGETSFMIVPVQQGAAAHLSVRF